MSSIESRWMTDELRILAQNVRRFLEREFVQHRERWDKQGRVDREAWSKAGEAGLLCSSIPEAYGGGGGSYAHELVICEETSRAGLNGGFGTGNVVHCIAAHYILAYGTEEQKQRWLPGMASGALVSAVAMTEPGTGSDLQAVRTRAVKEGESYVINGQKTFISNGQIADIVVVVAKTDPSAQARGVSLIVVETEGAKGFRRGRKLEKIGLQAQDTSELFFEDLRVPAANLLGGVEGEGFTQLMVQLAWERLSCAFSGAVAMQRAVELTVEYVKQREAFGKKLIEFQNTQFKLAEAKTQSQIARIYLDELIVRLLDGKLDPTSAAMAKLWTTETQCRVIDECLQFFGGYGYIMEYPIARLYADARVQKIYAGSNEIMKLLIARSL